LSPAERTSPRPTAIAAGEPQGTHSAAAARAADEGRNSGAPNPPDGSSTWLRRESLTPGDIPPPARPSTASLAGAAATTFAGEGRSSVPRPTHSRPASERAVGDGEGPGDSPGAYGGGARRAEGAAAASLMRTFALGPTPQNVDVYLDGERQFAYDTDHRNLTVVWNGPHQIEFRSPSGCCFVERIEVGPDRPVPPENVIARKLKWKPARLVVTTQPPASGVRIMVRDPGRPERGTVVGPGEEANIPFLPSDEAQKDIDVSVLAPGGMFAERVVIRAGERKAVVISIERGGGGPAAP
jgi:hypothetical protein